MSLDCRGRAKLGWLDDLCRAEMESACTGASLRPCLVRRVCSRGAVPLDRDAELDVGWSKPRRIWDAIKRDAVR